MRCRVLQRSCRNCLQTAAQQPSIGRRCMQAEPTVPQCSLPPPLRHISTSPTAGLTGTAATRRNRCAAWRSCGSAASPPSPPTAPPWRRAPASPRSSGPRNRRFGWMPVSARQRYGVFQCHCWCLVFDACLASPRRHRTPRAALAGSERASAGGGTTPNTATAEAPLRCPPPLQRWWARRRGGTMAASVHAGEGGGGHGEKLLLGAGGGRPRCILLHAAPFPASVHWHGAALHSAAPA